MDPWIQHKTIWPTEAKFMSWVRGGIRAGLWKKHPVKLEFLRQNTILTVNTNPRSMKRFPMVKAARCALCSLVHSIKDIEVDHLTGNHSLRSMDDLRAFIEAMIMVTFADLQLVCKPCHKIKSYAEKQGITCEEARAEKLAISLIKEKKDVQWLEERGIVPASSQAKRRTQIIQALQEGL
ncbi:hypothetical protein D3C84_217600 [compost metagenome]